MAFARALTRSFERRGYNVRHAAEISAVREHIAEHMPSHAIVDLKLGADSGLECVRLLHQSNPAMKIVVLTGFASIATAVEAVKLGACHYLPKPANSDDIEQAFEKAAGSADIPLDGQPTSLKNLEWERIHETLVATEFNISETARRLGMHRRTLARKLEKRRVK